MAKKAQKQVFVFEFEVMKPDPDDDDSHWFDIPETFEALTAIAGSLKEYGGECDLDAGDWYFLHNGEAIALDELPNRSDRGDKMIETIKSSADDGDEIYLQFAYVEPGTAEHWDSDFRQMSEQDGCRGLLIVYGNHSEFGPNVLQKYADGEFDTGIESERDPDGYTVQPDWDKRIGDRHLLEFLDASFYG